MKRRISFLLILSLVISSMSIVSFANNDVSQELAAPQLKAYSAYKRVALEWPRVEGVSYDVYKDGKCVKTNVTTRAYDNNGMMAYIDYTGDEGATAYNYYVVAKANGATAQSNTVSKKSVAPMFITAKFNRTRVLKSHDKKKVKHKFKKGTAIKAYSFRFGKYIFMYNGHRYFVNYMSISKKKAKYTKKFNYEPKEAEYFVNTSGKASSTRYLIWASLHTQHLYVLEGKKGNFRMANNLRYKGTTGNNWEISSGKAVSPSPSGMTHTIYKKQSRKNNVVWWNYIHSQTSLHGRVKNKKMGSPKSEGCIRNPDKYALLIYKKIPKKTRVMVY